MQDGVGEVFVVPAACDQCPHLIGEHNLWPPDEVCDGWMHCTMPGCDTCWHDWRRLRPDRDLLA